MTQPITRQIFLNEILPKNPGAVILKFGAEWCGPCNAIKPLLVAIKQTLPENAILYNIDIDSNIDLYAFFKQKKMLNGIPTILGFFKNNVSFVPDLSVSGANEKEIREFFNSILEELN